MPKELDFTSYEQHDQDGQPLFVQSTEDVQNSELQRTQRRKFRRIALIAWGILAVPILLCVALSISSIAGGTSLRASESLFFSIFLVLLTLSMAGFPPLLAKAVTSRKAFPWIGAIILGVIDFSFLAVVFVPAILGT